MRFHNARQSVHDAFAIHLKSGPMTDFGSSTKFDSDVAIFNGMKAGLIIKAVLSQSAAYRGCALILNAPEGIVNAQEVYIFKRKLWYTFLRKHKLSEIEQAEIVAIQDDLIHGHKSRSWNHESGIHTVSGIAKQIGSSPEIIRRVITNANRYLDILTEIDNASLQPVWKVINQQKEMIENEGIESTAGEGS